MVLQAANGVCTMTTMASSPLEERNYISTWSRWCMGYSLAGKLHGSWERSWPLHLGSPWNSPQRCSGDPLPALQWSVFTTQPSETQSRAEMCLRRKAARQHPMAAAQPALTSLLLQVWKVTAQ